MRSFAALRDVDLGLRADHVFLALLPLPPDRYKTGEQVPRFFEPLLARVKALPGVVDATVSDAVPPYGGSESRMEISGRPPQDTWRTLVRSVSEGYFRVLRLEFKQGRPFSEAEANDARKVVVVNERFVRRYLPGENPLGRRVRLERLGRADPLHDAWFEIVGVVADAVNRGLRPPIEPEVWMPYTIGRQEFSVLMVRTSQDPATIANAVRREVWATEMFDFARSCR